MDQSRDKKATNQRLQGGLDNRAVFSISGERINTEKLGIHRSAAALKGVLDYEPSGTKSSNDSNRKLFFLVINATHEAPSSKSSNQSKANAKPKVPLIMNDLAFGNMSENSSSLFPEFKSTLKVSRANLAKFGTSQAISSKSNKTFSDAQRSEQLRDLESLNNGNHGLTSGNPSGIRSKINLSFNESLVGYASNPSIFKENSKGQMSPHSQLGLSIVGNKHLDSRNQELSQHKNLTNTFITETKRDLDESIRNGSQTILNGSNIFGQQQPEEVSFNAMYSNSINRRNPKLTIESSLNMMKKEEIDILADQVTPQIRTTREKALVSSSSEDASPNRRVLRSQKSLDNKANSFSKSFILQNPIMNEFVLEQSQVNDEQQNHSPTIVEKKLSLTKKDSNDITTFNDSIDNHLLSQGMPQMPGDLLSRFTTTKVLGSNYINNKMNNEKLNKMQKELANTLEIINQKKQQQQQNSISDVTSTQDTRPGPQLPSGNEDKIEDVFAAKKEIDEVLKKNTLDPEIENEINAVLKKYSLEKSFWENYLEDKRVMLSQSEVFSGAGSENVEIDVKLEIKKFKKEYKLYQGRRSQFANSFSDRGHKHHNHDPNAGYSQTPNGVATNLLSGFSRSVKENTPNSSFEQDSPGDKKTTDSSPTPKANDAQSESPNDKIKKNQFSGYPRPLSGFARQKDPSTLVGIGSEVIINYEGERSKNLAGVGSKVVGDNFMSPETFAEFQGLDRPLTQGRPRTQGRPQTSKYVPSFTTIYDQEQNMIGSKQSLMNDHSFLGQHGDVKYDQDQMPVLDRKHSIIKNMESQDINPMNRNLTANNIESHRKRPPISPIKAFNMMLPDMPKRKEGSNQSKPGVTNTKRKSKQNVSSFDIDNEHHQRDESRKSSYKTKPESFHIENIKTARSGYTWTNSEVTSRSQDVQNDEEEKTIRTEYQSTVVSQTLNTEYDDASGYVSKNYEHLNEEPNLIKQVLDVEYTGPLQQEELLGRGSEARVVLVKFPNGEKAAMKKYELTRTDEKSITMYKKLKDEFLMLKNLNHNNVIRYLSLYHPKKQSFPNSIEFGIIMEYMQGGPLDQYVDNAYSKISLSEKKSLIKQILQGLDFLHSQHIVHRDIKPGNLLLSEDKKTVKITDFGVSKQSDNYALKSCVGTPWYMAPEVVNDEEGYTSSADIWSAGCCFFHLMTGKKPYDKQSAFQVLRLNRDMKSPFDVCDEEVLRVIASHEHLKDFLNKCFTRDKSLRITANELLRHPFLNDVSSEANGWDENEEPKWARVDSNDDNAGFLITALH